MYWCCPFLFLISLYSKSLQCRFSHHATLHPYPWKRLRRPVLAEIAAKRRGGSYDENNATDNDSCRNGIRIAPYEGFEQGRLYDKVAEVRAERMAALISATLNFASEGWLTTFLARLRWLLLECSYTVSHTRHQYTLVFSHLKNGQ
jgi:hypothetical protein